MQSIEKKIIEMPRTAITKSAFIAFHKETEEEALKFPLHTLPTKIQEIVTAMNDSYQIPIDYYGAGILSVASTAIGRGFTLKYKKYHVPPILYTALVGGVSAGKTPAMNFCVAPLREIDKKNYKRYREKKNEWDEEQKGVKPTCENILLSDVTTEAVSKALRTTNNGILITRDEIISWVKGFNQYKNNGGDEEYWLTAWNGGDIKINRSSSDEEVVYAYNVRASILGGLQPSVLNNLYSGNKTGNGFLARILFAYPTVTQKPYVTDIEPDEAVFSNYSEIIDKLYTFCTISDDDELQYIEISNDARESYKHWVNDNTKEINNEVDNETIKGINAKMELHCLRFALILELLDAVCQNKHINPFTIEVSKKQVENAILLSEYFKKTAERVFYRVYHYNPLSNLSEDKKYLYEHLTENFSRKEAIELAKKLGLQMSDKKISRFLKQNPNLFKNPSWGQYRKIYINK